MLAKVEELVVLGGRYIVVDELLLVMVENG